MPRNMPKLRLFTSNINVVGCMKTKRIKKPRTESIGPGEGLMFRDPKTRLVLDEKKLRNRRSYIDPFDMIRIYTMAENGLPMTDMAKMVGMSTDRFEREVKRNPELGQAIIDGDAAGRNLISGQLMRGIRDGNTAMIIFAAKVRLRMREKGDSGDTKPLPDDKKPDKIDFSKMTPMEAARVYQQLMKGTDK